MARSTGKSANDKRPTFPVDKLSESDRQKVDNGTHTLRRIVTGLKLNRRTRELAEPIPDLKLPQAPNQVQRDSDSGVVARNRRRRRGTLLTGGRGLLGQDSSRGRTILGG